MSKILIVFGLLVATFHWQNQKLPAEFSPQGAGNSTQTVLKNCLLDAFRSTVRLAEHIHL